MTVFIPVWLAWCVGAYITGAIVFWILLSFGMGLTFNRSASPRSILLYFGLSPGWPLYVAILAASVLRGAAVRTRSVLA